VVNAIVTVPAGMQGLNTTGLTEYSHRLTSPACRTENDRSPTAMDVLRSGMSPFRLTRKSTVPEPLPCDPDVISSHAALLRAFHSQPAGAVTVNDPDALSRPNAAFSGASSYVQLAAVCPCWLIACDCPPIVKPPLRTSVAVFALTE
jgi:hypothetical protein